MAYYVAMQFNAILALITLPFTMMVWSQAPAVTVDLGSPVSEGLEFRSVAIPSPHLAAACPSGKTAGKVGLPLTICRSPDGLFYAPVSVGGRSIPFVVDTGSTHVFMSRAAAEASGLDYRSGQRSRIQTAAGQGIVHWTEALSLSVANRDLGEMQVGVVEGSKSLLGYAVLERVGRVTIEGDRLTIGIE